MTLSDLAALGSFVSGIAVLASLVFLFFQMRQMTEQVRQTERNQRSLLMQQRAMASMDAMFHIASEEIATLVHNVRKGPRDLPALQVEQFFWTQFTLWSWLEDAHYQHLSGLFDAETFEPSVNSIKFQLTQPHVRAYWYCMRASFAPRFTAFVDGLLPDIPIVPVSGDDVLIGWNAALDQVDREMKETTGAVA